MKTFWSNAALFATALVLSGASVAGQAKTEGLGFRLPQAVTFRFDEEKAAAPAVGSQSRWVRGYLDDDSTNSVEFGNQVVLQLAPGAKWESVVSGKALTVSRQVTSNVFILQSTDAVTAMQEAARMAALPGVTASYPVVRQAVALDGLYAPRPNDPHFTPAFAGVVGQWNLENRDQTNGALLGPDLNVRAAWPYTRGEGITIAIGDTGIEMGHRDLDLKLRVLGPPHKNFATGSNNPEPFNTSGTWAHGTQCAGLAGAEADNRFGMAGVAPRSRLAGWVVFTNTSSLRLVSDDKLMDMFQYVSNVVGVQSHSWTHDGVRLFGLTTLENIGMENAVRHGRDGRGVVIVRPAGNARAQLASPNDDAYCSDPRVIVAGAVGRNGRVASYSERGSSVLIAAPSGDSGGAGLFSTDRLGTGGAMFLNFFAPFQYLSGFVFNNLGFSGTSAAAPQVAGVAALVLSANTNLTYRDVQQILLLSARHFDLADPDLAHNGAGLLVSHNAGFGVPDAGHAVKLARRWVPRPVAVTASAVANDVRPIPDDALRLLVTGAGVPENLASIRCLPSAGPHADAPTMSLPLVDLGLATNAVLPDLHGKAALIERGTNNFDEKILKAAFAGAEFAVIYNFATNPSTASCPGGNQLCLMGLTDFVPIPAIFIGHNDGLALRALFATNDLARARVALDSVKVPLEVVDSVICEFVGVRLQTDHPLRGDLRVTLVSPSGTRSVLQQYNSDTAAGPVDWTYWTTHHFFEPSLGEWSVELSDEFSGSSGSVTAVTLLIHGVPGLDDDRDGLDDFWEMQVLGKTVYSQLDDPDGDGYNNAAEQAMGTNPLVRNEPFQADLVMWDANLARLSWPAVNGRTYDVLAGINPKNLTLVTNVPGRFPEAEWFTPAANTTNQIFRVREVRP